MAHDPAEPDLVALGVIAKPHGIQGELRVHVFNPSSDLLAGQREVFLRAPDGAVRRTPIERVRRQKDGLLYTLPDVRSRDAADALRGTEVCVPRDAFPEPEADEVYHVDLLGLAVVDEAGLALGAVAEVLDYPSVDCLRVVDEAGEGEWEVPMLERYVVEVDLEARRVVVRHLEELPRATTRGDRPRGGAR